MRGASAMRSGSVIMWLTLPGLEEKVIRPFVAEYCRGRTPNPCVACNRSIKFGSLLEKALAWGFDGIATGHYAAIEEEDGRYRLKIPKDRRKDQTYFLYAIPEGGSGEGPFPLGRIYGKDEVREIAQRAGLPVFDKPESQDICFIPAEGLAAFLQGRAVGDRTRRDRGPRGRVIGRHGGIACYTIGQRSGLGISSPAPLYVTAIDAAQNRLVVGEKGELCRRAWWRIRSIVWSMPSRRRPGPRSAMPTGRQDAGFHTRATASSSDLRSRRRPSPRTVRRPVR